MITSLALTNSMYHHSIRESIRESIKTELKTQIRKELQEELTTNIITEVKKELEKFKAEMRDEFKKEIAPHTENLDVRIAKLIKSELDHIQSIDHVVDKIPIELDWHRVGSEI